MILSKAIGDGVKVLFLSSSNEYFSKGFSFSSFLCPMFGESGLSIFPDFPKISFTSINPKKMKQIRMPVITIALFVITVISISAVCSIFKFFMIYWGTYAG